MTELEPRAPLKRTSLIELPELPNFAHMMILTAQFESQEITLQVTSEQEL